jgi:hypothetical protein
VIEERSVRRLGSTRSEPIDVCIIAGHERGSRGSYQRAPARFYRRLRRRAALLPLRSRRDVLVLPRSSDGWCGLRLLARSPRCARPRWRTRGWHARAGERWSGRRFRRPALTAAGLTAGSGRRRRRAWHAATIAATDAEARRAAHRRPATGWNHRAVARLGLPRNTLTGERLGLRPRPARRRRGGCLPATPRAAEPWQFGSRADDARHATRDALYARRRQAGDDPRDRGERRLSAARWEDRGDEPGRAAGDADEPDERRATARRSRGAAVRTLAARARREAGEVPGPSPWLHTEFLSRPQPRRGPGRRRGARAGPACPRPLRRCCRGRRRRPASRLAGSTWRSSHRRRGRRLPRRPQRRARRTRASGRDRELRLLRSTGLAQTGRGQVVMIVGARIGASRLLHEFRHSSVAAPPAAEGQAPPSGDASIPSSTCCAAGASTTRTPSR